MDSESYHSAYRLGIGITLLYVVGQLVPAVGNYATLVVDIAHHSQDCLLYTSPSPRDS